MKPCRPDFVNHRLTRFYLLEVVVRPLLISWRKIDTRVMTSLQASTENDTVISHRRLRGSSASTSFVEVDYEKFSSVARLLDSPSSPLWS